MNLLIRDEQFYNKPNIDTKYSFLLITNYENNIRYIYMYINVYIA